MYGIWRRKEVVGCFKVIIWDGNASHKGGAVFMGKVSSHYVMQLY